MTNMTRSRPAKWTANGLYLFRDGCSLTLSLQLRISMPRITFVLLDSNGNEISAPFLGNIAFDNEDPRIVFHNNVNRGASELLMFPYEVLGSVDSIQSYLCEPKDCTGLIQHTDNDTDVVWDDADIKFEVWRDDPCVTIQGIPMVVFSRSGPIVNTGIQCYGRQLRINRNI